MRCRRPNEETVAEFFDPLLIGRDLDLESLHDAWRRAPGAVTLCATRRTVQQVNDAAVAEDPAAELGCIPVWCGDEEGPYLEDTVLREGTRVIITRNRDLNVLVNGARHSPERQRARYLADFATRARGFASTQRVGRDRARQSLALRF